MSSPLAITFQGVGNYNLVRFKQGLNAEVLATHAGTMPTIIDTNNTGNRANQIGNRLFWLADNKAYQKTGAGAVTQKLSNLGSVGSDNRRTGFLKYYMHPVNGPGLFGCTLDNTGDIILYDYLTDAWSVVDSGVNTALITSYQTRHSVVMNGIGYFVHADRIIEVDPVAGSVLVPLTTGFDMEIMPYNDILYVLRAQTAGTPYELGQWVGGVFILLSAVTGSLSPSTTQALQCQPIIYQIDGDTYVACNNDNTIDNGWVAGKWDGSVYTDVTATLLPASLQPGGSLSASNAREWRAKSWKVQEGPTTRTFINLLFDDIATSSILYEHVGATWVLRNSSQYGVQYSGISNPEAGADMYYDATELNAVRIAKEVAVANGMSLQYYVNGDEGTADTFAALFYSANGGGTWVRATIIAPGGGTGGGSSIAANNLQNIDADGDGGTPTTYTIEHDWTADGLSSLDSVWWQLRCSKTAF